MIEITHKQAQRMIREGLDRQLPDEQWAMLQAHLESCAECRAYRDRTRRMERDARHSLRSRWISVRGPLANPAQWVLAVLAARAARRRFLRRAAPYLIGALMLALFIGYRQVTAPDPTPTPQITQQALISTVDVQASASRTPTVAVDFRGLVAFESRRDGNAEIYLLSAAPGSPELTNLTSHPAQDTHPAWSPDGEWIAFLSDRADEKDELYVVHVAGSRLTRLTADPNIFWQGPIDWSFDGQWVTLLGRRGSPEARTQRYLVPVNAAQEAPQSLAFTAGSEPLARFSPAQPALAYQTPGKPGSLMIASADSGWSAVITGEDNLQLNLMAGLEGAYDWSLGGRSLVYVAMENLSLSSVSPARSQLRISPEIVALNRQYTPVGGSEAVDVLDPPRRFRAVSWMPNSLMIASLTGSDEDPCWTLRLSNPYNRTQQPRDLPGLCVVGGLERSNWTPDGRWLVLLARPASEMTRPGPLAFYALRLPDPTGRQDTGRQNLIPSAQVYYEKLTGLDDEPDGLYRPGSLPGDLTAPRVRPAGQVLDISPSPAQPVEAAAPPVTPPAGEGWVVYAAADPAAGYTTLAPASRLVRVRPDGSERQELTGPEGRAMCPRISPDGRWLAFTSGPANSPGASNQIYRMSLDGTNILKLTGEVVPAMARLGDTGLLAAQYDCPAWSPDGQFLVAVLRTQAVAYLAVIPANGQAAPRYLEINLATGSAAPVWMPASAGRFAGEVLLTYDQTSQPARIVAVDPTQAADPSLAEGTPRAVTETLLSLTGWDTARALALSPDGRSLAMLLFYQSRPGVNVAGRMIAQLRVVSTDSFAMVGAESLDNLGTYLVGLDSLGWLPGSQVAYLQNNGLLGPRKSLFRAIDLTTTRSAQRQLDLFDFEDVVQHAAWRGDWTAFTAETGLWVQQAGSRSAPLQISAETVLDADWR